MTMLAKVGVALKRLLGPVAEGVAKETGVIQRIREFDPMSLAGTFVLGHLWKPAATPSQLARLAVQLGAAVSPQAVDQRWTAALAQFLEGLCRESLKIVVGSSESLAPILERFTSVPLVDSSTIALPDSQQETFPGCGGLPGAGQAALKLQTEFDLRRGALSHVEIEAGRSPDGATCRQQASHGRGSLRISDLGYFCVAVFAAMVARGEHFLSRLQFGTGICLPDGQPVNLLRWLADQPGRFINQPMLLGLRDRLPCRLIAWRLPPEQAGRRRQKLRAEHKRKHGGEPTAERLAWCDWTILVTSVPPELLSPEESVILYRARWQIELLFKRWKSKGLLAARTDSTDTRQMIRFWSRLLACIVEHWLLVATAWGDPCRSLDKAASAIREFTNRIAAALSRPAEFAQVLTELAQAIAKTSHRNKRKKPGTFELLNDPDLLDFGLT